MGSLDLIFVTDTSGSLDGERKAIADGVDRFIEELPTDVDFRIGVILGHGSKSNHSGRLWHGSGQAVTMDSTRMSVRQIQNHLRAALTSGPGDSNSDGGEEMLYSFNKAITTNLAENRRKGLFRTDAALAVIFISDENDICSPGTVRDPDEQEPKAFARDCAGITPQSVLAAVKSLQGNRPFNLSAIAYTNPATVVRSGENELALGIVDLVKLANGFLADLASRDFDRALADIGKLTATKLILKTEFKLTRTNVNAASIKVTVDGKPVAHVYQASINEVHIQAVDAGGLGSVVVITYSQNPGG
ncbi:MAG TPA: hypothetical protein VM598_10245 [Bdellovibrionota bacterium]|nr:hypothetical protein [Bdellovibrionota bacterium]